MGALLKFEQTAYWQECVNCGITFGLLSSWDQELRRTKKSFFCPNGHSQSYTGKNAEEQLRAQLAEETRKRERAEREAESERAAALSARSVARNANIQKTKAQNKLKRITSRVHAGVCPHCNRTFKQLAAHMRCRHADLVDQQQEAAHADVHMA